MAQAEKIIQVEEKLTSSNLQALMGYQLRRASGRVQADLAQSLAQFNLRMITFSSLAVIAENPGLRQSQLADILDIERPNLVVIVDELETQDLIRRDKMPNDRRAYALRITDEGARLLQDAMRAVAVHEERMFGWLSDAEKSKMRRFFSRIPTGSEGDEYA